MRGSARFIVGLVGCACALTAAACSDTEPLAPSTVVDRAVPATGSVPVPVRISGRVIDWTSGAGVANVTVQLGGVHAATSAQGAYTMTLPAAGPYDPIVAGLSSGVSHVSGPNYRGDFLTNTGTCVSRYGTVASARTGAPIEGADVALGNVHARTDSTGWYRIDLGCPANPGAGFNPASFTVMKPGYVDWSELETRGTYLAVRIDLDLFPASAF